MLPNTHQGGQASFSPMARLALASAQQDQLPAAAGGVFSWRMPRRAGQSRQFSCSRLSCSWHTGQSRIPLQRGSRRGCRGSSVSLPWLCPAASLCCLLPVPSLSKATGTRGAPPSCPQTPTQGFPAALCSALCLLSSSSQGKGESRSLVGWQGKEQAHTEIKVREIPALSWSQPALMQGRAENKSAKSAAAEGAAPKASLPSIIPRLQFINHWAPVNDRRSQRSMQPTMSTGCHISFLLSCGRKAANNPQCCCCQGGNLPCRAGFTDTQTHHQPGVQQQP